MREVLPMLPGQHGKPLISSANNDLLTAAHNEVSACAPARGRVGGGLPRCLQHAAASTELRVLVLDCG